MITGQVGCGGLRIPIVDGRIVEPGDDPCNTLAHNRVMYSDGRMRQGWPLVAIDSSEGRDIYLSDPAAPLLNLLKRGYRFKMLGDATFPGLLWADASVGAQTGEVFSRLRIGELKRVKWATEKKPPSGPRIEAIPFVPAAGTTGTLVAAVQFGDGWLAEWRSAQKRWLVLHAATGKAVSNAMALPVDGNLFESQTYDGLHFLKREAGKPAELIIVPASVEWSRALN